MNSSVKDFRIAIEHWLQRDWAGQPDYWLHSEKIPVADVIGSFLSEFAQSKNIKDLPCYMRAMGHWPFLHLSRAIATATHKHIHNDIPTPQVNHFAALMQAGAELGFAEYLLAALLEEVRQRETFGVALIRNQHVEFTLAEIQATLLAAVAYWELAVENIGHHADENYFAFLNKELLEKTADIYLQFSGGRGYMKGHPAEIAFREVFVDGL